MTIDDFKTFLFWTTVINYGVLLIWFGVFVYAHDWIYRAHTRWFTLTAEKFDVLHDVGMSIYSRDSSAQFGTVGCSLHRVVGEAQCRPHTLLRYRWPGMCSPSAHCD